MKNNKHLHDHIALTSAIGLSLLILAHNVSHARNYAQTVSPELTKVQNSSENYNNNVYPNVNSGSNPNSGDMNNTTSPGITPNNKSVTPPNTNQLNGNTTLDNNRNNKKRMPEPDSSVPYTSPDGESIKRGTSDSINSDTVSPGGDNMMRNAIPGAPGSN